MKRFIALAVLAGILYTIPFVLTAQQNKSAKKVETMTDTGHLGTPIHTETKNAIKVQVWLASQAQHEKIMPATKDETSVDSYKPREDGSELSKDALEQKEMPYGKTGTKDKSEVSIHKGEKADAGSMSKSHVAVVMLHDANTDAEIDGAKLDLQITSPANKTWTVSLNPMEDHYANDFSMTEKGTYKFTLKINYKGKVTTMTFNKTVPTS